MAGGGYLKMGKLHIGVFCPIGVATGGPEALHQLSHAIEVHGHKATLIPIGKAGTPSPEYAHYLVSIMKSEDSWTDFDFIVTPETHLGLDRSIRRLISAPLHIWWLSVDNACYEPATSLESKRFPINDTMWPKVRHKRTIRQSTLALRAVARAKILDLVFGRRSIVTQAEGHLAQSEYAKSFVEEEFGLQAQLVSDYIPKYELKDQELNPNGVRERKVVAYGFAKGRELVERVKPFLSEVQFIPIKGMTISEVRQTLAKSDLYLDLGHFPGRDRLPREAALAGTPVLIARRGAGRLKNDFPLEDAFRLDVSKSGPEQVAESIAQILKLNREEMVRQQADFLEFVKSDYERFLSEVKVWLEKLETMQADE
jgi:hypothetical protein